MGRRTLTFLLSAIMAAVCAFPAGALPGPADAFPRRRPAIEDMGDRAPRTGRAVGDRTEIGEPAGTNAPDETGEPAETGNLMDGMQAETVLLSMPGQPDRNTPVWFPDGDRAVPYVAASLLTELRPEFRLDGTVFTCSTAEGYASFDVDQDRILQHRLALNPDEEDEFPVRHKTAVSASQGTDAEVDLSRYGWHILEQDGYLILPAVALSALFLEPLNQFLAWDGERLYCLSLFALEGEGAEAEAYEEEIVPLFYSGPWAEWADGRQQANYDALCFRFDNVYGMRQRWPQGLNQYLTDSFPWLRDGLLRQTDMSYVRMEDLLFNLVIDDIHTAAWDYPPFCWNLPAEERSAAYYAVPVPDEAEEAEEQNRYSSIGAKLDECAALREEAGCEDQTVRVYQDMAVLTWDEFSFDEDYWKAYQAGEPVTSEDTPGFLYRAFADLRDNHPEVKHIVMDLTANTGGMNPGVDTALGFMKREFTLDWSYGITGETVYETYRLDTNLDGQIDEADSLEGQYEFYILQSEATFSCANMLSYFAQSQDAARTAGERSGGGAYIVSLALDAYGTPYAYSSSTSYGVDPFTGQDLYVEPDIPVPSSAWYDDAALYAALIGEPPAPDNPDTPGNSDISDNPDNPGSSDISDNPDNPGSSDISDNPNIPDISDIPAGEGCYIATAVYGSYDCPEVQTLRQFRDQTLARTWYGRLFIRLYYAASPTAVRLFGGADWFQDFWRVRLDHMVSGMQSGTPAPETQ